MELFAAPTRAVTLRDPLPATAAERSSAPETADPPLTTCPPLARGSMVAHPWQSSPLRTGLAALWRALWQRSDRGALAGTAPWQAVAHRRRTALIWLSLVPALLASVVFARHLAPETSAWLNVPLVTVFGILFTWIAAGFWTAVSGFIVLVRGGDPAGVSAAEVRWHPLDSSARTAIVMPICNEHVPTVFAGLRATYESLAATGALSLFDFYVLSDSNDPELIAAEIAAWNELVAAVGGRERLFYRLRHRRTKRKAGNVADFCRRWGRNYRYMVVLDADSVMSGHSLTTMVKLMEAHKDAGIIQTLPRPVGSDTLHGRLQQFAARVTGTLFAVGMQHWQLGESHYWGHNAIIRVRPFMQHCALAPLPGRGALSGEVMSHDFIEAALMRRAGWHVWLVPDIGGSYEQVPPNLLAELQRDRRWCLGNLQNFRLMFEPGLHPVHRVMLATGAFAYIAAPLWLGFTLLSTLGAGPLSASFGGGFAAAAAAHPAMWALLLTMAALLLVPKALGIALVFLTRDHHRFGGGVRLVAGALAELVLSVLYAPIRMVFHSVFVASILAGRRGGWRSPPREEAGTPWREALRRHWIFAALAVAWVVFVADGTSMRAWWLLPMLAGLLLAVPLSVLGSRTKVGRWARAHGALVIPEEIWPPEVLRNARRHLQQRIAYVARRQFTLIVAAPPR